MKKITMFGTLFVSIIMLIGCGTTATSESPMTSETSVASLSYISAGFITPTESEEPEGDTYSPVFLSYGAAPPSTTTEFEGELEYINQYMNKLQIFMDNGFDAFDVTADVAGEDSEYTYMLSYLVEGELFTIYYNDANDEGIVTGIMIVGETTYDLVIEDNLEEEEDESKRNLILTATLAEDSITIIYAHILEGSEEKEKLQVTKNIDGVESEITIEIKKEEENFKVSIEDGQNKYNFKVEETEEGKHYKLNYEVDGIEGVAKINETEDEEGNKLYRYKITEGDVEKTIEKDQKGRKDKEKEEEDEEEEPEDSERNEEESNGEEPDEENPDGEESDNKNKDKDKDKNKDETDSNETTS